jgi:hypothetical protein
VGNVEAVTKKLDDFHYEETTNPLQFLAEARDYIANHDVPEGRNFRQTPHTDAPTVGDITKPAMLDASYQYGRRNLVSLAFPDFIELESSAAKIDADGKMRFGSGLSAMNLGQSMADILKENGIRFDAGEMKIGHDRMNRVSYIEFDVDAADYEKGKDIFRTISTNPHLSVDELSRKIEDVRNRHDGLSDSKPAEQSLDDKTPAKDKFDPDARQAIHVKPVEANISRLDAQQKIDLDVGDNHGSRPDMSLKAGPTKVDFDVGEAPKAQEKFDPDKRQTIKVEPAAAKFDPDARQAIKVPSPAAAKPDADRARMDGRREDVKANLSDAKQKIEGQKPASPAKPADAGDQRIKTTISALSEKTDKHAGRAEMAAQIATGDFAGAATTAAGDEGVQKIAAKAVEAVAEKPGFWASAAKYAGKAAKVARALPVVGGVVVATAATAEVYGHIKEGNYKAAATTAAARTAEAAATTVGGYVAGQAVYTGAQKVASAGGVEIAKSDAEELYNAAKEKLDDVTKETKTAPARGRSYTEPKRDEPTQTASANTQQYKARGASSPSNGFNAMAAKPADMQPKQPEIKVAVHERKYSQQVTPGMTG